MDLKQLVLVDPNLVERIIFKQWLKIDTKNMGFIMRKYFSRNCFNGQIVVEHFFQKKKYIDYGQFRRQFFKLINLIN